MNRNSYIFNHNKTLCTGCGSCTQVCTHHALSMKADEEGFLFPSLDSNKCVDCGLCDKICPVVNDNQSNNYNYQKGYIATTHHKEYYLESASTGICTMLSNLVIKDGGIVFGCFLDENVWQAYHIGVTDTDGIEKIRNSKYLQSDTKQTFTEVKTLLKEDKTILYIGTPCQIAGLKAFLRKDYPNLLLVDIICHGVFSPKLMPLEVQYWENKFKAKIFNFRFRSKRKYKNINGGMVNFDYLLPNGKIKHIERHASSSPSYRAYAYAGDGKNYNLRISCYNCPFRELNRYGDITIGDPWFIKAQIENKELRASNSVRSIYSINTDKGSQWMDKINHLLILEQMEMSNLFVQPATNKQVTEHIGEGREQLYQRINKEDYATVVEDLLHCNLDDAQKSFEKRYNVSQIKRLIKKLVFIKQ